MASISSTSLRAGKKIKDSQGSDKHLSKAVELNGKYRVFFPAINTDDGYVDISAAMVPGRTTNFDICGTGFIPYTETMYTKNDIGDITDTTGLQAWARIMRVIHNAQCVREKKSAEAEAIRTAQELGKDVDQVSLSRSLEGIELKYHGGKAADGTRINPSVNPGISGIVQKMSTRVAVVKLLPNGAPDWKNAQYAVFEISRTRMDQLIALLDNPNYTDPSKGYLEVGYDYIGSEKKDAGKAAFQGIVPSMSLELMFPGEWAETGKNFIDNLVLQGESDPVKIAEFLRGRNRNLKGGKTVNDIITSVKKWCAENEAVFGSIDYEDEATGWAAKDFLESHLVDSIPLAKSKFEELVAKQGDASDDGSSTVSAPAETTEATGPSLTDIQKEQINLEAAAQVIQTGAGQSIKEAAAMSPNVDLDADELGDL